MTRTLPIFFLLAAICLPMGACKTTGSSDRPAGVKGEPLVTPEPIDIKGLDKDAVSKAVFAGIESRGFIFESGTKTSMKVGWVRGRHSAKWNIDFAGDKLTIDYLDSQELDYNQDASGNPYIHRTYNAWTTNLRGDLAREVGKLRFAQ